MYNNWNYRQKKKIKSQHLKIELSFFYFKFFIYRYYLLDAIPNTEQNQVLYFTSSLFIVNAKRNKITKKEKDEEKCVCVALMSLKFIYIEVFIECFFFLIVRKHSNIIMCFWGGIDHHQTNIKEKLWNRSAFFWSQVRQLTNYEQS